MYIKNITIHVITPRRDVSALEILWSNNEVGNVKVQSDIVENNVWGNTLPVIGDEYLFYLDVNWTVMLCWNIYMYSLQCFAMFVENK